MVSLVISDSLCQVIETLKGLGNIEEVLHVILHGDTWLISELKLLIRPLLAKDHVAREERCVSCHLHSSKLANVREALSEILSSVLGRMVAKDSAEDHESE